MNGYAGVKADAGEAEGCLNRVFELEVSGQGEPHTVVRQNTDYTRPCNQGCGFSDTVGNR